MGNEKEIMENLQIAMKRDIPALTKEIKELNENIGVFKRLAIAIEKQNALLAKLELMQDCLSNDESQRRSR